MKKLMVLVLALLCVGALVSGAYADPKANAVAHVYLTVNPNIALQALDSNVNIGTLQTGDAKFPIRFRVDANTEAVVLSGLVTKLYKGNDPTGTEVKPIPVNETVGLVIDPANAKEIKGGTGIANYTGTSNYNGFDGSLTEELTFESSQNGHFSQEVVVTPTWKNDDNEKPQGEYSGFVILYASVVI